MQYDFKQVFHMHNLSQLLEKASLQLSKVPPVFIVENEQDDDFLQLLDRSGFADKGGYRSAWRRRSFESGRGYSRFRHYELRFLRSRNRISFRVLISSLGVKVTDHATVRELLKFAIGHSETIDFLFSKGKTVVGLGRDDFSLATDTFCALSVQEGARIVSSVPISGSFWNSDHVVLVRESRSS